MLHPIVNISNSSLRSWRREQAEEMRSEKARLDEERRERWIRENRDFIEFKRERKKLVRDSDRAFNVELYEKSKAAAELQQKLKDETRVRDEELKARKTEKALEERAIRRQQQQEEQEVTEDIRMHDKRIQIDAMKRDLLRQKEELMASVHYAQKKSSERVRSEHAPMY